MKMTLKRALVFTVLSLLMPWLLLCLQAGCTPHPSTASELHRLQGTWEGVELGQESQGNISLTITGNSIYFHRGTNWYETTFTLPAGTDSQQLRTTIKRSSYRDHIGKVVAAIFKIEDGTLTLAADQGSAETPKSFEDGEAAHYKLRKVHRREKNPELPKPK